MANSHLTSIILVQVKCSFQDLLTPIFYCRLDIESNLHYLLHCPMNNTGRHTLLSTLRNIDRNLVDKSCSTKFNMLKLYFLVVIILIQTLIQLYLKRIMFYSLKVSLTAFSMNLLDVIEAKLSIKPKQICMFFQHLTQLLFYIYYFRFQFFMFLEIFSFIPKYTFFYMQPVYL